MTLNNVRLHIDLSQKPLTLTVRAGIDFRRQNLTSKVDPLSVGIEVFVMAVDP